MPITRLACNRLYSIRFTYSIKQSLRTLFQLLCFMRACTAAQINHCSVATARSQSTTMRPVQGVSGLQRVCWSTINDDRISIEASASTVRALAFNTDKILYKAQMDGNRPFVLQAVMHDTRQQSHAAAFIHTNLVSQLTRMAKCCPGPGTTATVSPLYCCLLKLSHAFVKAFPEEGNLLKSECSIAVLDINSGKLYTLCFGPGTHLAHVCSELGHAAEPVSVREHAVGSTMVLEATYDNLQGQHHVVLGSPGLWKYTHPSKAGLHAAAYGAAPHLSTSGQHHDAATAIAQSALRRIVNSCASSSSARLRCLHSLSQLDRLRPGSRAEAKRGSGVVPRGRGDVHGDLSAAVFTFTSHTVSPQTSGHLSAAQRRAQHTAVCPMCTFAARHFLQAPAHACAERHPSRSMSGVCNCSLEASSAEHSIPSVPGPPSPQLAVAPALPTQAADKSGVVPQHPSATNSKGSALLELSRRLWDSIPSPVAHSQHAQHIQHRSKPSTDSLLCSSTTTPLALSSRHSCETAHSIGRYLHLAGNSVPASSAEGSMDLHSACSSTARAGMCKCIHRRQEAQRRWQLLQTHVWVTALERGLRRSMWESACTVAINALAPAAATSDGESFCSMPSSPASSSQGTNPGSSVADAEAHSGDGATTGFGRSGMSALAVLAAH